MERERNLEEERLTERVREALGDPQGQRLDDLDDLLTECAAQSLHVQAERMRTERAHEKAAAVANGAVLDLTRRRSRLAEEQHRLSELMAGLRDLRERIARSAA